MNKKKIAITGGSGFLAKYLFLNLKKNYDIILITRNQASKTLLEKNYPQATTKIINWDSLKQIKECLAEADILIHSAAMLPTRASANNNKIIKSSLLIARKICKANLTLEKFIFISTLRTCINTEKLVFEDDTKYNFKNYDTSYGLSKYITEKYFLKFANKLPLIICSPTHIIGPEKTNFSKSNDILINFLSKKIVFYTDTKYAIIDVNDVCHAIEKIIEKSDINNKYLLSANNPSLKELINYAEKITNQKKIKIYIPLFFLNIISLFFDIVNKVFKLKTIPVNRSSYFFAKLNKDFYGKKITNYKLKFKNSYQILEGLNKFIKN